MLTNVGIISERVDHEKFRAHFTAGAKELCENLAKLLGNICKKILENPGILEISKTLQEMHSTYLKKVHY